jgi:hypothetical protein
VVSGEWLIVIPAQAGIQLFELVFAGMGDVLPNSQQSPA